MSDPYDAQARIWKYAVDVALSARRVEGNLSCLIFKHKGIIPQPASALRENISNSSGVANAVKPKLSAFDVVVLTFELFSSENPDSFASQEAMLLAEFP